MTGDWATQPSTILYVLSTVVGDLLLPVAVVGVAGASIFVGAFQYLTASSRDASAVSSSSSGRMCRVISSEQSNVEDSVRSSSSSSSRSNSSSSSIRGSLDPQDQTERAQNLGRSGPQEGRSEEASWDEGRESAKGEVKGATVWQPSQSPQAAPAALQPAWLMKGLLAIYATRGALDVLLTAAVASTWLGGQVSGE